MIEKSKIQIGYKNARNNDSIVTIPTDNDFISKNPICWEIVQLLAENPFISQEELTKKFDISKEKLIELNTIIRNSEFAQNFMINGGAGSKYWKNTILPTIKNGKAKAVLEENFAYPDRVGLCPGLSCMFFCSFCGRNYSAKYEQKFSELGLKTFKKIIDETPSNVNKNKTYHITGGLEPLTFPKIGELISYGKSKGFNMEMQTNGFNLTSQFVEKQLGIKELSAIRISLYGVDYDSTYHVTKNKAAYEKVTKNLINFLKLNLETKVGLNYVILHENIDDVMKLIDYIESINIASENQIDFVTLREDFSAESAPLTSDEQEKLKKIFQEIDERLKNKSLNKLHIDFGYALESIRKGTSVHSLKKVTPNDLRKKAFPQIAVMIDSKGDVFAYHEAAFLDREGAKRYSIGVVDEKNSLQDVITKFLNTNGIEPERFDDCYLDAFDHVITIFLNNLENNADFGIPWESGPVRI